MAIANSPDCTYYAATDDGIFSGTAPNNVTGNLLGTEINAVAIDSNNNTYAGTENGEIYKSIDSGQNWTKVI